jgi:hypothetical protein
MESINLSTDIDKVYLFVYNDTGTKQIMQYKRDKIGANGEMYKQFIPVGQRGAQPTFFSYIPNEVSFDVIPLPEKLTLDEYIEISKSLGNGRGGKN